MTIEEKTDSELVTECLNGDEAAFADLIKRHQDAVFGLAVSMTHNSEDAADMAQDAFVRAYNKLEQYNHSYSFRGWILRICANLTKNLFRKRTRRRKVEEQHLHQIKIKESDVAPDFEKLEAMLKKIPTKLQAPLRLKYMEQLSYDEIASILGVGVSAAKMRTMRAKKQLMELMRS